MNIFWDVETYSECDLEEHGAYVYATDKSTDVLLFCYTDDDGEIQTWMPGDPVPAVFANPADHKFVSDNWDFERQILEHVLIPRYGFTSIPLENHDCAQRLALANAYPAKVSRRCEALNLPFHEDAEARDAMRRLSCPPPSKKPSKRKKAKNENPDILAAAFAAAREHDFTLLRARCQNDVATTRAAYNSPLPDSAPHQDTCCFARILVPSKAGYSLGSQAKSGSSKVSASTTALTTSACTFIAKSRRRCCA